MRKLGSVFVALTLTLSALRGQSVSEIYGFKKTTDAAILASGGATLGLGTVLGKRQKPIAEVEILKLKTDDIRPALDRRTTRNWSTRAGKNSDLLLFSSLAVPATLFFSKKTHGKDDFWLLTAMGFETYLLTAGLTSLTKSTARRTRPFAYNSNIPIGEKIKLDARHSFFSGHTSMSAAGCFFAAKVFTDLHPASRWKPAVWTTAALLPVATGLLRFRAGKHFPTDILTGYAVGGLCGWLVPHLHKKSARSENLSYFQSSFAAGNAAVFGLTFVF